MGYQAVTDSVVLVSPTTPQRSTSKKGHKKAQNFSCAFCGSFLRLLWLVDEAVADGVVREFGVGLHIHLVEDATTVGADRFIAE